MSTGYQIRIKGQLAPHFSAWFGDFTISHTPDGNTLLTGAVADQAALYGLVARCRDLGVTLISINPISTEAKTDQGDVMMNTIHAEASHVINARPEEIYAVISDYRVGHPAILPKPYFSELTIEQGGQGAGTVLRFHVTIWGQKLYYHQRVSEPEPGRVLVETDIETGQYSQFTLEPLNGGQQTRVTISSEAPASPGFKGVMERMTQPSIAGRLFKQELRNLEDYVRSKQGKAN